MKKLNKTTITFETTDAVEPEIVGKTYELVCPKIGREPVGCAACALHLKKRGCNRACVICLDVHGAALSTYFAEVQAHVKPDAACDTVIQAARDLLSRRAESLDSFFEALTTLVHAVAAYDNGTKKEGAQSCQHTP